MTEAAFFAGVPDASAAPERFPPVKPRWLAPATTIAVVLAHVGVAAFFMAAATADKPSPLDNSLSVDLIPEGDTIESQEQPAMEISEPQPEEIQEAELALPPPQLMTPEAIPLPEKNETVEPKKHAEPKPQVAPSHERQEASERHRLGVKGGKASQMSRASYMGQLATEIHRHVPSVSSLGPGSASCSLTVTSGGAIVSVSCSGSSPSHTSLLRTAILSTRTPGPPPGGGFSTSQAVNFH